MENSKIVVKTNLKHFANRVISVPGIDKAQFNANCEIEVTEEQAIVLLDSGLGFSVVDDQELKDQKTVNTDLRLVVSKNETVSEKVAPTEEELEAQRLINEQAAELQKKKDFILSLKTKTELKKLAEDFPKEEWEGIKDMDKFKEYLISKI